MNTYVAIDLETTGLHPKNDRIIEVGAIKVADGDIKDKFSTFVNPCMSIPLHIQQLTGITTDMAKEGPTIEDVIPKLIEFCEDYALLGHSLMFDYSFIKHKATNMGLDFEREGIDTLAIARKKLCNLESRRLCDLCRYYKIAREQAHRAMDDAIAAHLLYQKLKADFEGDDSRIFRAVPMIYKVKKQGPITSKQKDYLNDLLKYHRIEVDVQIDSLTRNEASRLIDRIISENGRMWRNYNEQA